MAKQKTGKKPKSAPCDKIRKAKNLRKGASNKADRSRRFQVDDSLTFCLRTLGGIILPADKPIEPQGGLWKNGDPNRPRYGLSTT